MARGHALIVDDSSTARIILARLLERADLTTKGAESAEQGLIQLRQEHFDLVFLDHLLPGMNGFEALEAIKKDPATRDIPVFMYTSQSANRYLQDARARGAAGVIGKQVDRNQLLQTIEMILAKEQIPAEPYPSLQEATSLEPTDFAMQRRVTGRLATLEIAYEETHEELRHLKHTLSRMESMYRESLDKRHSRMKWLLGGALAAFSAITLMLTFEISEISGVLAGLDGQLSVMREIVGSLVDLVEIRPGRD